MRDIAASGLDPATIAIRAGRGHGAPGDPLSVPPVLASVFHTGTGVDYGRVDNPTWRAFEEALGVLEGGRARAFASGIAAVTAVLELLPVGATVVAPTGAYSGTRSLLGELGRRGRLDVRLVDITDNDAVAAASRGASLVWVESPTNPLLGVADLPAIAELVRGEGARLAVDNTFATPLLQRPLELGADVVVHSATKFIAGHSDVILGATVTASEELDAQLHRQRTMTGAIPGAFECWLVLRGLRTLPVRLDRGQENAAELARRLAAHPRVSVVRYPGLPGDPGHARAGKQMRGFGAVVSFEVAGGGDSADRVCDAVRLLTRTTSLGGVETTLERRNRQPGEEHVPPGLIRMSVGCEHVDDLWADLEQALGSGGA